MVPSHPGQNIIHYPFLLPIFSASGRIKLPRYKLGNVTVYLDAVKNRADDFVIKFVF